jgi:hypothetical protein
VLTGRVFSWTIHQEMGWGPVTAICGQWDNS